MHIIYGLDAKQHKLGKRESVMWSEDTSISGHKLIVGMSGSGKTYLLRNMIAQMSETVRHDQLRVHIFDCEDDIHIDNASNTLFSETSPFGLNPLAISTDEHSGGVRKCVARFLATINQSQTALGSKQEACLRKVLYTVYENLGFILDDPSTWITADDNDVFVETSAPNRIYLDVPFDERFMAKDAAGGSLRWDGQNKLWYVDAMADYKGKLLSWPRKLNGRRSPNIKDIQRKLDILIRQIYLGSSEAAILALEETHGLIKRLNTMQRKRAKLLRVGGVDDIDAEIEKIEASINKTKEKALGAFGSHLVSMQTGKELNSLLEYGSIDVIKSVLERVDNLAATGIFKTRSPEFDTDCLVWRYRIKPLSIDERRMYVNFRLMQMLEDAYARGEQPHIRDVIVVDEAHYYFSANDENNILNLIAKVGRKFGLALVCASQSVEHFTKDFLSAVSTTVYLGMNQAFWSTAVNKLGLKEEQLKWVKVRHSAMVLITKSDTGRATWYPTLFIKSPSSLRSVS